jgi:IS4 transposase
VQRGDLVLLDLGYFNIKTFHEISVIGAYFLSRLSIGIRLIDPKSFSPIDLLGVLKKITGDMHEMQIIVGGDKETQVCCRVICLRVSQVVANARRRKLKKTSRERGRTPGQYHLLLADWTLMIINVPRQWLLSEMVTPFYSLRWQIELLFKQIKSVLRIHNSRTGKENRCSVKYAAS